MANSNTNRIGSISAPNFLPYPPLIVPKLPEKIRRIDPEGAEKWHAELSKNISDWIKSVNVGVQQFQQNVS